MPDFLKLSNEHGKRPTGWQSLLRTFNRFFVSVSKIQSWDIKNFSRILIGISSRFPRLLRRNKILARFCHGSRDASKKENPGRHTLNNVKDNKLLQNCTVVFSSISTIAPPNILFHLQIERLFIYDSRTINLYVWKWSVAYFHFFQFFNFKSKFVFVKVEKSFDFIRNNFQTIAVSIWVPGCRLRWKQLYDSHRRL